MTNLKTTSDGYTPWGKSVSINLFDCDLDLLTNPNEIKRYISEIIPQIEMVAHGPTYIERFGDPTIHPGPGYSAMQFIETSSITVHCDEPGKRVFIDIFSCKEFDAKKAEVFSRNFFNAKRSKSVFMLR